MKWIDKANVFISELLEVFMMVKIQIVIIWVINHIIW
jgi:hypothetical protein